VLLLLLMSASYGYGQEQASTPGLAITDIWARATVAAGETDMDASAPTSAVYMTLTNNTDEDVRLVGAQTDVAGVVEIHESSMNDEGVMQMRPLTDGLSIPAGETVELRPGGLHLMLMDLQVPLAPETAFLLTLTLVPEAAISGDSFLMDVAVPVVEMPPLPGDLRVTGAWARPTVSADEHEHNMDDDEHEMDMGAPTSAVYLHIENTGEDDVTLLSGAADAAGVLEIHETRMNDEGVMQMRPLMDGLAIAAGETVELRPAGLHLMLMDLQTPLVPGEALYLELTFDNEQTVILGVPIDDRMMGGMEME